MSMMHITAKTAISGTKMSAKNENASCVVNVLKNLWSKMEVEEPIVKIFQFLFLIAAVCFMFWCVKDKI